jgi:trehalose-phosphatase
MKRILLASDFDGVIVPRGAAPGTIRWHARARALFRRLQDREDVALAIISGRDPEELLDATRGIRCYIAGSYGRYVRDEEGTILRDPPQFDAPEGAWAGAVRELGGVVERKRHGVAVHWRMSSALGPQHAAVVAFRAWARGQRLRVLEGHDSCEAVVRGPAKLGALRFLVHLSGADSVIYAGDDDSDFRALRWAALYGSAFYVGREGAVPGVRVSTVRSIADLWRQVGNLRVFRDRSSVIRRRLARPS